MLRFDWNKVLLSFTFISSINGKQDSNVYKKIQDLSGEVDSKTFVNSSILASHAINTKPTIQTYEDYVCAAGKPCKNGACCGASNVCGFGIVQKFTKKPHLRFQRSRVLWQRLPVKLQRQGRLWAICRSHWVHLSTVRAMLLADINYNPSFIIYLII
jgi:hypothetical protein